MRRQSIAEPAAGRPSEAVHSSLRGVRRPRRAVAPALALVLAATATLLYAADKSQPPAETAEASDQETLYSLTPDLRLHGLTRVRAELEVGGELKVQGDKGVEEIPMSVVAGFEYDEKLLLNELGERRRLRSIRHYDKAEAVIKIGKGGLKPSLPEDRRLIVADHAGSRTALFCPAAPLSRDELDLIDVVGNTLILEQLLPKKKVRIGEKWEHPANVMGALLGLDATSECNVESELTGVDGDFAKMTLTGSVQGATEGVATEIEVKAKYHFHLKHRRITGFNLAVKEDRSIGHVGPGVDIVAQLKLQLAPIARLESLSADSLRGIVTSPTEENLKLAHHSASCGVRFACDRGWYVTREAPKLIVLRLIDRGDLVAQCNITRANPRKPDEPTSLAEFQDEIQQALGKSFGQFIRAGQWTDDFGQRVCRVVVSGEASDLPIEWRYFLIQSPGGGRISVAVTAEAALAERLGDADRRLVETLRVLDLDQAARETETK